MFADVAAGGVYCDSQLLVFLFDHSGQFAPLVDGRDADEVAVGVGDDEGGAEDFFVRFAEDIHALVFPLFERRDDIVGGDVEAHFGGAVSRGIEGVRIAGPQGQVHVLCQCECDVAGREEVGVEAEKIAVERDGGVDIRDVDDEDDFAVHWLLLR